MAGLMMFRKGLSVRDRFDNIRMDYIDKTNLIGDSRWSDRLTYEGTWENNRFNFFTRVMPKLTADLQHPFKLEGMDYEKLIITLQNVLSDSKHKKSIASTFLSKFCVPLSNMNETGRLNSP